jgi:hypothetical protein
MGAGPDGRGRLPEPGLADGGLERLRAGIAAEVDEPKVGLRRQAAMQAGGQIARLGMQELPGGFPGGEEGVLAIGGTSKALISTTPPGSSARGRSSRTTWYRPGWAAKGSSRPGKSGWAVAARKAAGEAHSATLTNRNSASPPRLRCSAVDR